MRSSNDNDDKGERHSGTASLARGRAAQLGERRSPRAPRLAPSRFDLPCPALPCLALPCPAWSCLALPCHGCHGFRSLALSKHRRASPFVSTASRQNPTGALPTLPPPTIMFMCFVCLFMICVVYC